MTKVFACFGRQQLKREQREETLVVLLLSFRKARERTEKHHIDTT